MVGCVDVLDRVPRTTRCLRIPAQEVLLEAIDVSSCGIALEDLGKKKTRKIVSVVSGSKCDERVERRTRDSNPQPVSRRLISNQVPNHSAILRIVSAAVAGIR